MLIKNIFSAPEYEDVTFKALALYSIATEETDIFFIYAISPKTYQSLSAGISFNSGS